MKNERIPIERAREISQRHGWPAVIVIGIDRESGDTCFRVCGLGEFRNHGADLLNKIDAVLKDSGELGTHADQGS